MSQLSSDTADLHPAVEPIAFLLGTWRGEGEGRYPTISDFGYGEEVRFWHIGKPFLAYSQRTWSLESGAPLHGEMGYWRMQQDRAIEVVLAHPLGIAEILEGRVDGQRIELRSTNIGRTSTAKLVTEIRRLVEVDSDVLTYALQMAAVQQPCGDTYKRRYGASRLSPRTRAASLLPPRLQK